MAAACLIHPITAGPTQTEEHHILIQDFLSKLFVIIMQYYVSNCKKLSNSVQRPNITLAAKGEIILCTSVSTSLGSEPLTL